jgi:anti-sigma factor RsiW
MMGSAAEFDDITLMRYADGELDAATSTAIDRALETDETLAERLALFMETRSQAKAAFAPLLGEPVPAALAKSVQAMVDRKRSESQDTARVLPFAAKPRPTRSPWLLPLAASLVAAVAGGLVGYQLAGPAEEGRLALGRISQPALDTALLSAASGDQLGLDGGSVRMIATFRNSAGALCREFEVDPAGGDTVVSVACRRDGAWNVTFAVAAAAASSGYAPASSLEALESYLTAIDAQPPLQPDEEKSALAEARQAD